MCMRVLVCMCVPTTLLFASKSQLPKTMVPQDIALVRIHAVMSSKDVHSQTCHVTADTRPNGCNGI